MNESLVRKFCESRYRKLIVVIGTTLFGLAVLIPLVDDYLDNKKSHSTLNEDLDRARQTTEGLPALEQKVAEITSQLEVIEATTVSEETLSEYRNKLVELVRETNCQVRRLDVGSPNFRTWLQNDNPLNQLPPSKAKSKKTSFTLKRHSAVLLVDGSADSVRDLLKKLDEDDAIDYLRRLELKSGSRGGERVTLELEMWLFALDRKKA